MFVNVLCGQVKMKVTKKYLSELKKNFFGKRIIIDGVNDGVVGTIDGFTDEGKLIVYFDNGSVYYLTPEDDFHEVYNWEL